MLFFHIVSFCIAGRLQLLPMHSGVTRVLYLSSLDSAYTVKIPISSFSFFKCFILSNFIAPTRIPVDIMSGS